MNKFLKMSFHALLLCFFISSTALFAPEGEEEPIDEPTNQPTEHPTWEEAWMMHEKEHQPTTEPVAPDKPLNWDEEDEGMTDSGSQPETPVSDVHLSFTQITNEALQNNIESFQNATNGQPKINAALRTLNLEVSYTPGVLPTLDEIDEAYDAQIKKLNKDNPRFTKGITEGIQLKEDLDAIKKYLDDQVSTKALMDSFTIINHEDVPAPKLNSKLQTLNESFTQNLSTDEINTINTKYESLTTPEQKEAFVKNINVLSKDNAFDTADIIQAAYDDALNNAKPKEQSLTSKLWNTAERFWNKTFKSEKAYVKTVIKQALNGDEISQNLIKSAEIKEYFKPLDLAQKKEILQTLQDEATKIGKNLTDIKNVAPTDSENPASIILAGKKIDQIVPKFTNSVNELVDSFKPMCDDGQKIIYVWDRQNHNPIINLVDFSDFTYNPDKLVSDQIDQLIKDQNLTVPQYTNNDETAEIDSVTLFKTELATEIQSIIDFQTSKIIIHQMHADKVNANLYKFSKSQIADLTLEQITKINPENIMSLNRSERSIVLSKLVKNIPVAKSVFAKFSPTQLETLYTQLPVLKAMLNS